MAKKIGGRGRGSRTKGERAKRKKMLRESARKRPMAGGRAKAGKRAVYTEEAASHKQRILEALENEKISAFLIELAGPEAPRVLQEIAVPASAELAAKNANLKVSGVRAVLNKLHSHGIVEYARVKDENTGWLSYVWSVKLSEVLGLLQEKEKMLGLLQAQGEKAAAALEDAPGSMFLCARGCGGRIPFDEAFDLRFRCGNCGAALKSANGKA